MQMTNEFISLPLIFSQSLCILLIHHVYLDCNNCLKLKTMKIFIFPNLNLYNILHILDVYLFNKY